MVWSGWSRAGKTEDEALAALVTSADRYAAVAKRAGAAFDAPASVDNLRVVERLRGGSGTDFGIPSLPASTDANPMSTAELRRQLRLLEAAWATFDAAAAGARGLELRKGPRGGGRTLTKIVTHVLEAEEAYRHQLGSRPPRVPSGASVATRMAAERKTALASLELLVGGEPLPDPNKVRRPWTPRYFVRRSAWHAIDHAWEIEDRAVR